MKFIFYLIFLQINIILNIPGGNAMKRKNMHDEPGNSHVETVNLPSEDEMPENMENLPFEENYLNNAEYLKFFKNANIDKDIPVDYGSQATSSGTLNDQGNMDLQNGPDPDLTPDEAKHLELTAKIQQKLKEQSAILRERIPLSGRLQIIQARIKQLDPDKDRNEINGLNFEFNQIMGPFQKTEALLDKLKLEEHELRYERSTRMAKPGYKEDCLPASMSKNKNIQSNDVGPSSIGLRKKNGNKKSKKKKKQTQSDKNKEIIEINSNVNSPVEAQDNVKSPSNVGNQNKNEKGKNVLIEDEHANEQENQQNNQNDGEIQNKNKKAKIILPNHEHGHDVNQQGQEINKDLTSSNLNVNSLAIIQHNNKGKNIMLHHEPAEQQHYDEEINKINAERQMISAENKALENELKGIDEKIKKLKNTDPLQQIQKQILEHQKTKIGNKLANLVEFTKDLNRREGELQKSMETLPAQKALELGEDGEGWKEVPIQFNPRHQGKKISAQPKEQQAMIIDKENAKNVEDSAQLNTPVPNQQTIQITPTSSQQTHQISNLEAAQHQQSLSIHMQLDKMENELHQMIMNPIPEQPINQHHHQGMFFEDTPKNTENDKHLTTQSGNNTPSSSQQTNQMPSLEAGHHQQTLQIQAQLNDMENELHQMINQIPKQHFNQQHNQEHSKTPTSSQQAHQMPNMEEHQQILPIPMHFDTVETNQHQIMNSLPEQHVNQHHNQGMIIEEVANIDEHSTQMSNTPTSSQQAHQMPNIEAGHHQQTFPNQGQMNNVENGQSEMMNEFPLEDFINQHLQGMFFEETPQNANTDEHLTAQINTPSSSQQTHQMPSSEAGRHEKAESSSRVSKQLNALSGSFKHFDPQRIAQLLGGHSQSQSTSTGLVHSQSMSNELMPSPQVHHQEMVLNKNTQQCAETFMEIHLEIVQHKLAEKGNEQAALYNEYYEKCAQIEQHQQNKNAKELISYWNQEKTKLQAQLEVVMEQIGRLLQQVEAVQRRVEFERAGLVVGDGYSDDADCGPLFTTCGACDKILCQVYEPECLWHESGSRCIYSGVNV